MAVPYESNLPGQFTSGVVAGTPVSHSDLHLPKGQKHPAGAPGVTPGGGRCPHNSDLLRTTT